MNEAAPSGPAPRAAWRRLRAAAVWLAAGDRALGLAMALLCLYYVVDRGVFQGKASGDGWFGFQYLHALVYQGTLDMQRVIPEYLPYFGSGGPGHHMPNRCPFGPVLVWLPFYLVACLVERVGVWLHLVRPLDGGSPFHAWLSALGTLAGVLIGWRALYLLLRRHSGVGAARLGAIGAVWATPIAWYTVTQPLYQHGLAFAAVALLVERWDAWRAEATWRRWALLGLIGGFAMSVRLQEALFLLLPGGEALVRVLVGPARRRWLGAGVALTLAAALAFLPQMLVWRYYTGSLFTAPQVEPLRLDTPFPLVTLFSTRAGLFPWTPIAYAALAGLGAWRRAPRLALGLLALFAVEVYVVSAAWVVTSGYAYGARRLSDCAVLLGVGVALASAAASARAERGRPFLRRLLLGFTALCLLLNVAAMELVRARRIPSSGAHASSAGDFLAALGAPPAVVGAAERIGYPFVQPVGWLFALRWGVPPGAFEGVVGDFLLDRDGQWFRVQAHELVLTRATRAHVAAGLELDERGPARVRGPVRLLLPLFAREPIEVALDGATLAPGGQVRWNGAVLTATPGSVPTVRVPAELVRPGVNELGLDLAPGSTITRLDLRSLSDWWMRYRRR